MQTIQNSAFKEKAAPVVDVSKILPEPGAVVLNKLDGRLYAADKFGWHRFGDPYSPITLFIDFDGATQFAFKFRAPATSTLTIHDGDGTVTDVPGQDDTLVTHTTNFSEAGVYYFYVDGDVIDLTTYNVNNATMISGSIEGLGILTGLTEFRLTSTGLYGGIRNLYPLTNLVTLLAGGSGITGSITPLNNITGFGIFSLFDTEVTGDISGFNFTDPLAAVNLWNTNITWDTINTNWDNTNTINIYDCNWSPRMVDNCLKSLVNCVGATIDIGGNNAKRTAASDAAFAIVDANNTLTVNS